MKIFPRAGSDLAEKLFSSTVEAAAHVRSLGDLTDAQCKLDLAASAVEKLNEVISVAEMMSQAGYYSGSEVNPLSSYAEKVVAALSKLIDSLRKKLNNELSKQSRAGAVVLAEHTKPENARQARKAQPTQPAQYETVSASEMGYRSSEEIYREARQEMMAMREAERLAEATPEKEPEPVQEIMPDVAAIPQEEKAAEPAANEGEKHEEADADGFGAPYNPQS